MERNLVERVIALEGVGPAALWRLTRQQASHDRSRSLGGARVP